MDDPLYTFAWILAFVMFVAGIVIGVTFLIKGADQSKWTPQYNGCYVRQVNHNRVWSPDTVTKTLYCPTSAAVK